MSNEETNKENKKYFLETNVQYLRLIGTESQKKVIQKQIDGATIYTSYYVLREFHFIYTLGLIDLYNYIENYSPVGEAVREFVTNYSFGARPKRLLQIIAFSLSKFTNKVQAKAQLELLIFKGEEDFMKIVNYMIHLTECPILKVTNYMNDLSTFYDLLTDQTIATLERFFRRRTDKLDTLISVTDDKLKVLSSDHKKEFQKLQEIYKKINRDPSHSDKPKIVTQLGDTVIALEYPTTTCLLTFDEIFKVMSPALSKDFIVLNQPPHRVLKRLPH
jgi:hypothetical protein